MLGVHGAQVSWGKGYTSDQRRRSTVGELIERSVRRGIPADRIASMDEMGDLAIDPRCLGIDTPEDRHNAHVEPFDTATRVGWVAVHNASTIATRYLHWPTKGATAFYHLNSNGAAVHTDATQADHNAALELIERDAFLRWWYRFSQATPFAVHHDPRWGVINDWLNYANGGWQLRTYTLPTIDDTRVALVVAIHGSNPLTETAAIVVGTAADNAGDGPCRTCSTAVGAALEVVQFLESSSAGATTTSFDLSDFARYFTPTGVTDVLSRLPQETPRQHECTATNPRSPMPFADRCWYLRRKVLVGGQQWHFRQAFSTETIPYTLPGQGYRLDHPVVRELASLHDVDLHDLSREAHPLG